MCIPDLVAGLGARLAGSKGGRLGAKTKQQENESESGHLLDAVRRLEAAVPPWSRGEIIDKLMPRYGNDHDPTDGVDYTRARKALAAKVRRAEKKAAARESNDA